MAEESFNPGLSEEAWKKLCVLVTRLSIKYSTKAVEEDQPKPVRRTRPNRSSSIAN